MLNIFESDVQHIRLFQRAPGIRIIKYISAIGVDVFEIQFIFRFVLMQIALDKIFGATCLARRNAEKNSIMNVAVINADWLHAIASDSIDILVSNPPYIDEQDPHLSQGDVRFEPSSALTAKQEGFADLFYIASHAQQYLNPQGCLLMEHGWQQAQQVQEFLKMENYKNVDSGKDLAGRERFTFGFHSF